MFETPMDVNTAARLRSAGKRQGWLDSGAILLAVSGGSDSVAMLLMMKIFFKGRIYAAHVEHGIRGEASVADSLFVEDLCRRLGIRCFTESGRVLANMQRGESVEMAARRVRYDFFKRVCGDEGIPFTGVAHTADDLVETQIFNLFRGTGISGLAGIQERRDGIVRPLISFRREELREILRSASWMWREDETNEEYAHTRNRIRGVLIPWLEKNLNPNVHGVLTNLSEISKNIRAKDEKTAARSLMWCSAAVYPALAAWKTKALENIPRDDLALMVREQGRLLSLPVLDYSRTMELCRLIMEGRGWRFQWKGTTEVCGAGEYIGWIERGSLRSEPSVEMDLEELKKTGQKAVRWGGCEITAVLEGEKHKKREKCGDWSISVPWDGISGIKIGSVHNILNMDGRMEKVRQNVKIPWWARYSRPAVTAAREKSENPEKTGNIWVPGIKYFFGARDASGIFDIFDVSGISAEGKYGIILRVSPVPDSKRI